MLHEVLEKMSRSLLGRQPGAESLVAGGALTAEQRLQLHRNNIYISLTEALAAIYPVVQRLVGAEFFRAACREYIPRHAPQAAPMLSFGEQFSDFLQTYRPASALDYLPDVARLEWACHRSFHAADAETLDAARLAEVAEADHGRLKFDLHPSAYLLRSDYPVYTIWQANQADEQQAGQINLDCGSEQVLVARRGLDVSVEAVSAAEWEFLVALSQGQDLETADRLAVQREAGFDLARTLMIRQKDRTLIKAWL